MTISIDTANAYPLSWPQGTPRNTDSDRIDWRGGAPPFGRALDDLLEELRRLGVHDWQVIVSTDRQLRRDGLPYASHRPPEDPGVAVWFRLEGESRVLACDRYRDNEGNLRAITKTIEALRGIDRWGVGDRNQAFAGYAALPPAASDATEPFDPWHYLGLNQEDATADDVREAFRHSALIDHPDQSTGSHEAFKRLTDARDECLRQLKTMDSEDTQNDGGAA